jgi:3-hydroxymyristoyl/3-hydroxydecanoyl-(acyl carrier protein) dehydratase
MTGRYSAFTFCDRITEYEPARHAQGEFLVPDHLTGFPASLCAEATGQLAAWVAMANIGFRGRPVAALAKEVRILGSVVPGDTLHLEVHIEECDEDAVAYHGHARANGHTVVELVDCLGPMLPQAEYDDPDDLGRFLETLRGPGAAPGRFGGIPHLVLEDVEHIEGSKRTAVLHVPANAPFFADHFPRRPVFPATLLLDQAMRVASELVNESGEMAWQAGAMKNIKMRDFILPGQAVMIVAERNDDGGMPEVKISARIDGRTMATARIAYAAQGDL